MWGKAPCSTDLPACISIQGTGREDDVGSVPTGVFDLAAQEQSNFAEAGLSPHGLKDETVSVLVEKAAEIDQETVTAAPCAAKERDLKIDRVLTGKKAGIPVMLSLLAVTFWLTIAGANVPSQLLGNLLFRGEEQLGVGLCSDPCTGLGDGTAGSRCVPGAGGHFAHISSCALTHGL